MSIAVEIQTKTLTALVAAVLALTTSAQSVNLSFDAPVPGTLTDVTGQGTGFTTRLPGTGSALPANDPTMIMTNGRLQMTAVAGNMGNPQVNLAGINVPVVTLSIAPGNDVSVSVRIYGLSLPGSNDHTGVLIGTSTQHGEFLTYAAHAGGYVGLLNYPVGWASLAGGAFAAGDDLELRLRRCAGSWTGTWLNLTTGLSGSTGPQLGGVLGSDGILYVGLVALNPGTGGFTASFDNFHVSCCGTQSPLGQNGPHAFEWSAVVGGNGNFYEVVVASCPGISWDQAAAAAEAAGGHLATLVTSAENDFVFGLVPPDAFASNAGGPWLGGRQLSFGTEPAAEWRWTTGEPFSWTNWAGSEPNNVGDEDHLQFNNQGTWNDLSNSFPNLSYIVEYEPSLPCTPPVGSAFTLCAAHNAAGDARLQIFNLPTDTLYGKTLISTAAATPLGSGAFFGLNADLFTLTVLLAPPQIGDPLSWWSTEPGIFPDAPYLFSPGLLLPFAGTTWDLVAVAVTTTGAIHFSNFVQNTW